MKISELQKGKTYYILKYTDELIGLMPLELENENIYMQKVTFNKIIGDLNKHVILEFLKNGNYTINIGINYPQYYESSTATLNKELLDISPRFIITTSKAAMKKIVRNKLKPTIIKTIDLWGQITTQQMCVIKQKQKQYQKIIEILKNID